ncbi:MAG TPA: acetoacetate decarboxylase family protein [Acidimicrobiales bacterium]|nr:acetoacetate decarboxylase family protein [Acidimicrobiales bacterium]
MSENRWIRSGPWRAPGSSEGPLLPSLEGVYATKPEIVAAVIPPPLEAPPDPRVHVRITNIDIDLPDGTKHQEKVGYFAVDALYEGTVGEYPLLIPIDLDSAVSISRERFGEPKKLAEIHLGRDGDHVEGAMARQGVTFAEMVGDITGILPVPEPYPATQFWFKFLPAVDGIGFDAGPILVRVDQIRSPKTLETVEGKLVLRDLATAPVADLPVDDLISLTWTTRRSSHQPVVVGPVDADAFAPFAAARYDHV